MSEANNETEILKDGRQVTVKVWKDNSFNYMTYYIPAEGLEDYSEQALIGLVKNLDSFNRVPAEYTRQAGLDDNEDEDGKPIIEMTFALGNND